MNERVKGDILSLILFILGNALSPDCAMSDSQVANWIQEMQKEAFGRVHEGIEMERDQTAEFVSKRNSKEWGASEKLGVCRKKQRDKRITRCEVCT